MTLDNCDSQKLTSHTRFPPLEMLEMRINSRADISDLIHQVL